MEIIVILVVLALLVTYFKDVKTFVYGLAIIEIFLRIMSFIKINLKVPNITNIIDRYLPNSIPEVINKYSSGLLNTILMWAFVICMAWFLVYLVIYLFKRK